MQTFLVRRAGIAANAAELDAALTRLRAFEDAPRSLQASWLHSYALRESDGRFGLACIFQADSADSLLRHAEHTRLPAAEVLPIEATLRAGAFTPARAALVRRRACWPARAAIAAGEDLGRRVAAAQANDGVAWMASYLLAEANGTQGTCCLYQADDLRALHRHARRAGLPADEVVPVLGRIVFRDEPQRSTSSPAVPA